MEGNQPKRTPEEVLFKWEDNNENKRRNTSTFSAGVSAVSSLWADPMNSSAVNTETRNFSNRVVPSDRIDEKNVHVEAQRLRETVASIQLSHNREWLANNTNAVSLKNLDVVDRISCLLINKNSAMRYEAKKYLNREGRLELDFHRQLYQSRITRLNRSNIPEYCLQPVYIRNITIVARLKNKCECPLHVYVEWNMRHNKKSASQQPHDYSLGTIHRHLNTTPFYQSDDNSGFMSAREWPGAQYMPRASQAPMRQFMPGYNQSNNFVSSNSSRATGPVTNTDEQGYSDAFSSFKDPAAPGNDATLGDWTLSQVNFSRKSQVSGIPNTENEQRNKETNKTLEHLEAVCPMHAAIALPYLISDTGGSLRVITNMGLMARYDKSVSNNKTIHALALHKLSGEHKVHHFRLPSQLQCIDMITLRDIELERYSLTGELEKREATDKSSDNYLSHVYTGKALFIATVTEFIIAVVHESESDIRLGVIYREMNTGLDVRDILCHNASGRIFLLCANCQLYEFQYQLGSVDTIDKSFLGKIISAAAKGCKMLLNALSNDRVYRLHGTVPSGYAVETPVVEGASSDIEPNWWDYGFNCLNDLAKTCPSMGTAYWPPVEWRALHLSLERSAFFDTAETDCCKCVRSTSCIKRVCRTSVRIVNSWNRSWFGVLASADPRISIDEERWILAMLCHDSGDLCVFRIQDTSRFDSFINAVTNYGPLVPYNMTFYCLRQGDMLNQLVKAGYTMYVGSTMDFKAVDVFPAPNGRVEGVDIVVVDNVGTRIYVGFVADEAKRLSLVVKGFSAMGSSPIRRMSSITSQNYLGRFFRDRFSETEFGTFATKKKYFYINDLFMAAEFYPKNSNLIVVKVTVFTPETVSLCEPSGDSPQSISEELWYHNRGQMSDTKRSKFINSNIRPVEWFDEFCLLMSPGEDIIKVYSDEVPCSDVDRIEVNWDLVIVTTQKVYKFRRSNLKNVIESLLEQPRKTLKCIDPPSLFLEQVELKSPRTQEALERTNQFVDIFAERNDVKTINEESNRELVAYGLYYLCWLYTPEEVLKACWNIYLSKPDNLLESWLVHPSDGNNLLLSSIGISSGLFRWTAPGAYAINDKGNPTTPICSPWCKFVVFDEPRMYRFNRISTGITSAAVDGALSLIADMIEPLWLERMFVSSPMFSCGSYVAVNNGPIPFTPSDQIPRKNEFIVGPKFNINMVLSLSRPVEYFRALLTQMRRLYLVLREVTVNYEAMPNEQVTSLAQALAKLSPKIRRDIFPEVESQDGTIESRLTERHQRDVITLKELVTLLEISQEYVACCILLHNNCIMVDTQHEFELLYKNLKLLPSHSTSKLSSDELLHHDLISHNDPNVAAFNVQHCDSLGPYTFTMAREFFYAISRSNMLNLCSNQEFFRTFRVAVWLAGGEVSSLQEYFYGHMFKPDELCIKHWSTMVKSLERQLSNADSNASVAHYARLLMRCIGDKNAP
ncbi:hypothetical protein BBOV_III001750 [Babesia bovis T2Bo]|uniref:Uncharacterized protein n=1 Tax=Babesia bovis TaxID=5865 RepID=A7AMF8_BABBO|nr:hypothetical protein BBOV_III001750 [Babesia bovis T2Bo]EDO07742.1 hypothetical protein BBOV_III001750 [Babesia bovis T2Bo]|eukprot:XP_001611310.1 hypothetical protein [Babesia bovis T2Bo]